MEKLSYSAWSIDVWLLTRQELCVNVCSYRKLLRKPCCFWAGVAPRLFQPSKDQVSQGFIQLYIYQIFANGL